MISNRINLSQKVNKTKYFVCVLMCTFSLSSLHLVAKNRILIPNTLFVDYQLGSMYTAKSRAFPSTASKKTAKCHKRIAMF